MKDGPEDVSICLCGAQAGYPHKMDCPRPAFYGTEATDRQWERDRADLRARLAAQGIQLEGPC